VVALTAHAMREDRQRCLDAGCDEYLSKPFAMDELLDCLRKFLSVGVAPQVGKDPAADGLLARDDGGDRPASGRPTPAVLAADFARGLPQQIKALGAARLEGRTDQLATITHDLAGCAAMFGYAKLGNLAQIVASALRQREDRGLVDVALDRLIEACREVSPSEC